MAKLTRKQKRELEDLRKENAELKARLDPLETLRSALFESFASDIRQIAEEEAENVLDNAHISR